MACPAQDIQFLEKHHVAYMTPKGKGIAKACRPPMFRKLDIQRAEPKTESRGWFTLELYKVA